MDKRSRFPIDLTWTISHILMLSIVLSGQSAGILIHNPSLRLTPIVWVIDLMQPVEYDAGD